MLIIGCSNEIRESRADEEDVSVKVLEELSTNEEITGTLYNLEPDKFILTGSILKDNSSATRQACLRRGGLL